MRADGQIMHHIHGVLLKTVSLLLHYFDRDELVENQRKYTGAVREYRIDV